MKPTPLLDFWQKPADAGEPVALVATTYALDSSFFEQNCLARFLEVSSVDEETGSVDDVVAAVELHELLQKTRVTLLADRSAPVVRTSLLWDLLSCQVQDGLLHAKMAVLLWENATRVILGSANLTAAGYRQQIELGVKADLGPGCLFPPEVLTAIADELEAYLALVPGWDTRAAPFVRATSTIAMFRQRIAQQRAQRFPVRVAFAPTNDTSAPLQRLGAVWSGAQPMWATHLSPFWDSDDASALTAARKLLTGRPAHQRSQHVAVVLGPAGQTSFSPHLAASVDSVQVLKELDNEVRRLHAKCLLIESADWVAALVGSSNHTKSGLGLTPRRHREMNIWLGAPADSKEGKALRDLIQLGRHVPPDAEVVEPKDEDESQLPSLPSCFGLCSLTRESATTPWRLELGIVDAEDMPERWEVNLAFGGPAVATRDGWEAAGRPRTSVVDLPGEGVPIYVVVRCDGAEMPWAVVADDRHDIPPGPALASLRARHLLDALATGKSLAEVLRSELERAAAQEAVAKADVNLDPLSRLEVEGSLLRKGRALAASLTALQNRLDRQVISVDTLKARLAGPLGPEFVASKVVDACEAGEQHRSEAIFTVAEIALSVGRVDWARVLEHIDRAHGVSLVAETFDRLDCLRVRLGDELSDLSSYARRAIEEARKCLQI